MFTGLDHVAILVTNTEEALRVYRDRLGLPVLLSEVVNNGAVRLTHLDMGNVQLQLVEPLDEAHPLAVHLREHGPGLHHLCFAVENVETAMTAAAERGIGMAQTLPHQGTQGKRAAFLDRASTGGVPMEITGA
jgi:methylmalonyl-CoA/ethylmalonyl-CoA epimerase